MAPSDRTTTAEPLLRTRFAIPAIPADLVVRERLLDAVSEGVRSALTLVSAPAGSGKTVLVSSWLEHRVAPGPVLWMTMDDGDERPGVFWSYVLAGLQRIGIELDTVRALGPADAARSQLDRLAAHLAERDEPVVIVLDDGDYLVDRKLGGDLGYLLRHCDGRLRIVLVTRTDPSLPLHRYRLDGVVTEIRAADLAFDETETAELLGRSGLTLAARDVAALLERTRGWPAGLKFAAMALAGRADTGQVIRDFTGDDGDVAAYLVSEVLDAQPPQLREVLLRTSIVDQLEPGLVEALTGQPVGQRTLEFMARGNSFIQPVSGAHGCYRYQSLFRGFLRAQLRYERPQLVPLLHGTAAAWLAQQDRAGEAVAHAVAAGDWAAAARYVIDDDGIGALVVGCRGAALQRLFAPVPDDVPGADACLVRAARAVAAGDTDGCRAELTRARADLSSAPRRDPVSARFAVALLDALVAQRTSDLVGGLAAVSVAEHLLGSLSPAAVAAHPELTGLVVGCRGGLLLLAGELASAEGTLVRAAAAAEAPGCDVLRAELLGLGALAAALDGRLCRSLELADRADVARHAAGGVGAGSAASSAARAWVRTEEYDLAAAREHALDADVLALPGDRVVTAVLALVRARLLRADGDLTGALTALRTASGAAREGAEPTWLVGRLGAVEADLLVAQGLPAEAVDRIEQLEDLAQPEVRAVLQLAQFAQGAVDESWTAPASSTDVTSPLDTQVTGWLVQAVRSAGAGDRSMARAAIERSLRLAAPERLRRPFREASPVVRRMLRPGGDLAGRYPWLDVDGDNGVRVPHAPGARAPRPPQPSGLAAAAAPHGIVDPLTKKEREVLGHLADLLSTEEIARSMFVSVNTVRTHVRSILRKLGAARRNEAIRRAWDLGLLPAPGGGLGARPVQRPLAR
ncbi:MAG: LuxR C-terminal-related transcriptional regulator [Cellulomonas sp.]